MKSIAERNLEADIEEEKRLVNRITISLLMPTIPERKERFRRLLKEVQKQIGYCYEIHPTLGAVHVIVDDREKHSKGGPFIGQKRQSLIERATGKYLCFLDDDEEISPDYIETLLRLCYTDKDVGTFSSFSKFDNYWCLVRMSLKNTENEQAQPGIVERRPWHICPVRTDLAKQAKFPESNYGEDWVWFEQVLSLCQSEEHTERIIHSYVHSLKVSQADNVSTAI